MGHAIIGGRSGRSAGNVMEGINAEVTNEYLNIDFDFIQDVKS
jgi:hypothetical protein